MNNQEKEASDTTLIGELTNLFGKMVLPAEFTETENSFWVEDVEKTTNRKGDLESYVVLLVAKLNPEFHSTLDSIGATLLDFSRKENVIEVDIGYPELEDGKYYNALVRENDNKGIPPLVYVVIELPELIL